MCLFIDDWLMKEVHIFGMRSPKVGYICLVQGDAFSRKLSQIFSVTRSQSFIGRPGILETRVSDV